MNRERTREGSSCCKNNKLYMIRGEWQIQCIERIDLVGGTDSGSWLRLPNMSARIVPYPRGSVTSLRLSRSTLHYPCATTPGHRDSCSTTSLPKKKMQNFLLITRETCLLRYNDLYWQTCIQPQLKKSERPH